MPINDEPFERGELIEHRSCAEENGLYAYRTYLYEGRVKRANIMWGANANAVHDSWHVISQSKFPYTLFLEPDSLVAAHWRVRGFWPREPPKKDELWRPLNQLPLNQLGYFVKILASVDNFVVYVDAVEGVRVSHILKAMTVDDFVKEYQRVSDGH